MEYESDDIDMIVNSKKRVDRPKCVPPVRYVFVIMGFLGFIVIYALRVNLSVAIVSMVASHGNSNDINSAASSSTETCPISMIITGDNTTERVENVRTKMNINSDPETYNYFREFYWDDATRGIVLGSFFWGYVITQLPGGRMAEIYGSKKILGYAVLFTSLFTIISPIAARIHYSAFIAIRILEGLCEGVSFPTMHAMLAKWLPKYERSLMSAFVYSGSQIGTVITMPLAAVLCDTFIGWPSVFYILGILGIVWSVFWMIIVYETPHDHPHISQKELRYILQGQYQEQSVEKKHVPWAHIFRSVPLWALVITHFGQNWGFYTLLTQLPNYFSTVLHFDLKSNGVISALPYMLQAIIGWFSGFLGDKIIKSRKFRVTTVRKIFNTIAFVGPALCLYSVTIVKCNALWSVIYFTLAMGINGFASAGFIMTHLDMSPNYAGTLMGITNCIANFAGILAPYTVGVIIQGKNVPMTDQWNIVFYIACFIYMCSALIFILFGSADLQQWNHQTDFTDTKSHPIKKYVTVDVRDNHINLNDKNCLHVNDVNEMTKLK